MKENLIVRTSHKQIALSKNVTYVCEEDNFVLSIPEGESILIGFGNFAPIEVNGEEYRPTPMVGHPSGIGGIIGVHLGDSKDFRWRIWAIPDFNAVEIANVEGGRCKTCYETNKDVPSEWVLVEEG